MLNQIFRTILILVLILVITELGCGSKKSEPAQTQKQETDQMLKLADLPLPVRTTVEKLTAGGEIKRITKDTEDGQMIYDIDAIVNDKEVEYDISPDGSILSSEESIEYSTLPKPVCAIAEKYFGMAEGLKAHKEIEKGMNFYEIEGEKEGCKVTLKLSETGQIVEEEKEEQPEFLSYSINLSLFYSNNQIFLLTKLKILINQNHSKYRIILFFNQQKTNLFAKGLETIRKGVKMGRLTERKVVIPKHLKTITISAENRKV